MDERAATGVRARQDPLRVRYQSVPEEARITDRAKAIGSGNGDPFHGSVTPGSVDHGIAWPFGIHRAVGGDHDAPNPGDILCAALATCLKSTIHMIADRLGVELESLEVDVAGEVDVRGTLAVDRSVPVGFQAVHCRVSIEPRPGTDSKRLRTLMAAAEHSCVVLQTLRNGVTVDTSVVGIDEASRERPRSSSDPAGSRLDER